MYKEHPYFRKPKDENAPIWRYMDFAKFISLLDTNALFFVRSDKLEDDFEGSYSRQTVDLRPIFMKRAGFPEKNLDKISSSVSKVNQKFRKFVLLNCWHANEGESAAMWKLYCSCGNGIAIQSTFKRLADSFQNSELEVNIGEVQYVDHETALIPEGCVFSPFLYKRKSFAYEKELRACILLSPLDKGDREMDLDTELCEKGKYVPINVIVLIDKIILSPDAEDWYKDLVDSMLHKYDFCINSVQSNLKQEPLF